MNFKYSVVCIIGLSIALIGCDGVPEADAVNCSGKGMEKALTAFKNDEAGRQAFIDKCNALNKEK
ncbi:entry exclusion lipoprotein TrbK [Nitrosomonas sp. Nm132]|jgi:entry exclusion lipoprotein TrbK|uniref:entry exclusion lipoprotein TrbK n=1 Tax=Nitrosomonas sp. Nm132 TaxID=1881053 RepID=UPI0008881769|nr:entry exclusion lipoprotein TrbK [Nitrosomonas sp. Nm132]SDH85516.1 entry exclusion lipoprotein TrbK [Nitrosomonas sp. Nm132]